MLNTELIHPPLLAVLSRAGHGSTVLIADANYPSATAGGPNATTVFLNFRPGLLTVDQVLETLRATVPIEAAVTMRDENGREAPPHAGYQESFGDDLAIDALERFAFYERARDQDLAVLIATGDERPCANLLLTIGVRTRE